MRLNACFSYFSLIPALVTLRAGEMMPEQMHSYIRTYRRRLGLTQDDLAVLLELASASAVSRHECGRQLPLLETALGYERILSASLRDLFEHTACTVDERIARRSAVRLEEVRAEPVSRVRDFRLCTLERLAQSTSSLEPYVPAFPHAQY